MAESKELKNLLMKVKEESEKVGLKLNIWHMLRFDRKQQNFVKQLFFNKKQLIKKVNIVASSPITLCK